VLNTTVPVVDLFRYVIRKGFLAWKKSGNLFGKSRWNPAFRVRSKKRSGNLVWNLPRNPAFRVIQQRDTARNCTTRSRNFRATAGGSSIGPWADC